MRRRFVAAVAGAVLGLGAVTACTGSDSSDGSGDPGTVNTDPGKPLQTMGADGIPADFPRDEVPLLTGGEVSSVQEHGDGERYDITMILDQTAAQAVTKAVSLLEDAGWSLKTGGEGDPPPVQVLMNDDKDLVIIDVEQQDSHAIVSYTVELG